MIKDGVLYIEWTVEDLTEHYNLSDKEALEVLESLDRNHDSEVGVNWDSIENTIRVLFPDKQMYRE